MPFVRSCLELAWGDLSSNPVQDLGNPATGDPILACDGRTGHPGKLEADDLEVTLLCVLSAESFTSFWHDFSLDRLIIRRNRIELPFVRVYLFRTFLVLDFMGGQALSFFLNG